MAHHGQPQPVEPVGSFWNELICQDYLERIYPGPDDFRSVHHFWPILLRHYFTLEDNCGVDGERCTTHPRPRQHLNSFVVHLAPPHLQRRRVIAVEARWFPSDTSPGWENNYDWTDVRETLRAHMLSDWTMRTTVQTTYGIVAVGDRVRFYYMSKNDLEGELRTWNGHPVDAPGADQSPILNIFSLVDQGVIHQLMLRMRQDVLSGCNTY
ncbi:hypothetical protein ASPFODRAFT_63336 [Aspergillus luchuensis CBS 106.47]|uniref:Uncharacterized protein n=1 Tax=Aspergillus luchuensis (strain CBS 106.47) TaxID=1137211 RepID=A0A1M3T8Q3_ASPLC|nr:hypothetical protein ASPFODRAFT_63336 [Aspergillus luchuensis CBS 106.47]